MTEQLLAEFAPGVASWTLVPSDGGRFEVEVNGELIYSKLQAGRHPEVEEIRQAIQKLIELG